MLSYQHGYHAGNRADMLKHAALDAVLRSQASAGGPLLYLETHAGRGVYDLGGEMARKTGEARKGVLALRASSAPRPLKAWLELVERRGAEAYPGSPALAAERLGEEDRAVLFERHPAEHKALSAVLGSDARLRIVEGDGYREALRLAPRSRERLLCFVDPSYETVADMETLAEWAPKALKRWPDAVLAVWLPLFRDGREEEFAAYLAELEAGVIAGARWPVTPADGDTALEGSALIAYRADGTLGAELVRIGQALQSLWAAG